MRLGLVLVLAALGVVLVWLARTPSRARELGPAAVAAGASGSSTAELAAFPTPADEPGSDAQPGTAATGRARLPGARNRAPEALRAPVAGRVVVAESGDPIEAVLSLRLRTIDLVLGESLVTHPDGTFRSTRPFPRARLLAAVETEEGIELVDHEAPFDPAAEDEWLVCVPASRWPTFAFGRVVDRRGTPLVEVKVSLVGLRPELPYVEGWSDDDGTFRLAGLRAGPYRLHEQGAWARSPPAEVTLRSGPNPLGDVVLAEPPPAGDLRVRIQVEEEESRPDAWLELADEGAGRAQRFDTSRAWRTEAGTFELVLPGLPAGRYTLSVHALDGLSWEPAALALSPPTTVELRARGRRRPGFLFRAQDARTGEAVLGFSVFGRRGRTWGLHEARQRVQVGTRYVSEAVEEVRLRPGYETWIAFAPGYRAAAGSFAGAGPTIVVALEPGWSELYQFEDAEGDTRSIPGLDGLQDPPVLADVEVHLAGNLAGLSDADGFFALAAEREPEYESIQFRRPGWRVVGEGHFGILRTVLLAQSP